MNRFVINAAAILLCVACNEPQDAYPLSPLSKTGGEYGSGLLILNEGPFDSGFGTLDFLALEGSQASLRQNVFQSENQRVMGSIGQSLSRWDSLIFLTVNNSGRVEILNRKTMVAERQISGLTSPRKSLVVGEKLFITDLFSDEIAIANLNDFTQRASISVSGWTEDLVHEAGWLYVTQSRTFFDNRPLGEALLQIDPISEEVVDSLAMPKGPKVLTLGPTSNLWVLCDAGGVDTKEQATLVEVRLPDMTIIRSKSFDWDLSHVPVELHYSQATEKLYLLAGDLLEVDLATLKFEILVSGEGHNFSCFSVDPSTAEVYLGDAKDYNQAGEIVRYGPTGELIASYRSGLIPGDLHFLDRPRF